MTLQQWVKKKAKAQDYELIMIEGGGCNLLNQKTGGDNWMSNLALAYDYLEYVRSGYIAHSKIEDLEQIAKEMKLNEVEA